MPKKGLAPKSLQVTLNPISPSPFDGKSPSAGLSRSAMDASASPRIALPAGAEERIPMLQIRLTRQGDRLQCAYADERRDDIIQPQEVRWLFDDGLVDESVMLRGEQLWALLRLD